MRVKEKITPSLRAALDKLAENVEPLVDAEHANFLPKWNFSQSTEKITITIYAKNPDPILSYCEIEEGGFSFFACYGWFKK
jgi:hypothetical protein